MVEEVISLEEVQVELPEEDILETGVEINLEEEEEFINPLDTDHYSNLAENIDKQKLGRIAADLFDKYESDRSSRKDWADQYSKGLRMLGVITEDRSDPFPGASGVHHPLMAEAATQFQARAIAEMFPPGGPVKTQIIGKVTDEKLKQATRVQDFMNYQLTQEMPEYFSELDQLLFYLAVSGSAFKKVYYDTTLERVRSSFIPAEDFVISYGSNDLETSERYTQVMKMSSNDLRKYIASGFYKEIKINSDTNDDEINTVASTIHRLEGVSDTLAQNTHTVLEIHCDYNIEDIDNENAIALPYIITLDSASQQVLAIRRNWKEDDERKKKRIYYVHYKYLPGLGFYGFGLIHMIGGLQHAATGALRALLDSAAFANLNGGFKAKGARIEGGDMTVSPGAWLEVEAYGDDLKKSFMQLPFKEPSPTLMQLLGILTEAGRRFSSIADAMVGDAAGTSPVGTTIAQIEQGSKIFSAIHKRVHHAQGHELKLIGELDGEYLPNDYPYEVIGDELSVRRSDFDNRIDIIPVSDPNIFSQAQRIALAQTTLQMAQQAPQIIDIKEAYKRLMLALALPDPDSLIIDDDDIMRRDPVSENMALLNGKPIKAFSDQNHAAHMAVHEQFISDPRYGGRPEAKEALLGPMLAHIGEHLAFQYRQQMQAAVDQVSGQPIQLPMPDFDDDNKNENEQEMPIEMENQLAQFEAQSVQLLAESQPPDPDQVKEQRMAASDEANIAIKQEEMSIRKERFVAGEKNNERTQSRKDKELQLKALDMMDKQKNKKSGK
mgnify:FL=1|tara:strand:+ start:2392 stop:4725 length:2334 start_codon:yes stop_codon:yes gene_type:complete